MCDTDVSIELNDTAVFNEKIALRVGYVHFA